MDEVKQDVNELFKKSVEYLLLNRDGKLTDEHFKVSYMGIDITDYAIKEMGLDIDDMPNNFIDNILCENDYGTSDICDILGINLQEVVSYIRDNIIEITDHTVHIKYDDDNDIPQHVLKFLYGSDIHFRKIYDGEYYYLINLYYHQDVFEQISKGYETRTKQSILQNLVDTIGVDEVIKILNPHKKH